MWLEMLLWYENRRPKTDSRWPVVATRKTHRLVLSYASTQQKGGDITVPRIFTHLPSRYCPLAWGGGGWSFGWRTLLTPHPSRKSMSPRRRVALIQTYGGSRKIRNQAGRFVASPYTTKRSFHGVKIIVSSKEKTDSPSSTPSPCRQNSPSAKTTGNSVLSKFP